MLKIATALEREYLDLLKRARKLQGRKVRKDIIGGEAVGKIDKIHVNNSYTGKVRAHVVWNNGEEEEVDLRELKEW